MRHAHRPRFHRLLPTGVSADRAFSLSLMVGILAALSSAQIPTKVAADLLTVRADGSGEYPTIQAAVLAASHHDTIGLEDGLFRGPGNRDVDFLGKVLVIRSLSGDPTACTVDSEGGVGNERRGFRIWEVPGPGNVLEGITVEHGYRPQYSSFPLGHGGAVACYRSSLTLRRCIFRENWAQYGGAVYVQEGDAKLLDCSFTGNTGNTVGGGLQLLLGTAIVEDCVFTGNLSTAGGGLCCDVESEWTIRGCTITGNRATAWGGGAIAAVSTVRFERSIVYANCADARGDEVCLADGQTEVRFACSAVNTFGIYVGSGTVIWEDEPVEDDPGFCDPRTCAQAPTTEGRYELEEGSPCLPALSPCGELIGAFGVGCPGPSGVEETASLGAALEIEVFPNPCTGHFWSRLRLARADWTTARLLDASGRQLHVRSGPLPAGESTLRWDVAGGSGRAGARLPAGIAFLVVDVGHQRARAKILILR